MNVRKAYVLTALGVAGAVTGSFARELAMGDAALVVLVAASAALLQVGLFGAVCDAPGRGPGGP